MKVRSFEEAMRRVQQIFPTDFAEDDTLSNGVCKVYRSIESDAEAQDFILLEYQKQGKYEIQLGKDTDPIFVEVVPNPENKESNVRYTRDCFITKYSKIIKEFRTATDDRRLVYNTYYMVIRACESLMSNDNGMVFLAWRAQMELEEAIMDEIIARCCFKTYKEFRWVDTPVYIIYEADERPVKPKEARKYACYFHGDLGKAQARLEARRTEHPDRFYLLSMAEDTSGKNEEFIDY